MRLYSVSLLLIAIMISSPSAQANQPERAKKWNLGAEVGMSFMPSFTMNEHQQQYELGLTFGRTITPFFYLGLGTSYIFYSGSANCLPVWLNPRVYFSRKPSSFFLDFKAGLVVYAPPKAYKENIIQALSGAFTFDELSLGYQIKEHLMLGVYATTFRADVWLADGSWFEDMQPFAAGLKIGYVF